MPWFGAAIAFVLGVRRYELSWAALFVASSIATVVLGRPSWPVTFGLCFIATFVLVGLEIRKHSYHGVLWRRINPDLPQW